MGRSPSRLTPSGAFALDIEDFISRWTAREGGAERANYQMFLSELCDVPGVAHPNPAGADRSHNDYVFERAVRRRESDGGKRIEQRVVQALNTLARYGNATALPDGRFVARKAA